MEAKDERVERLQIDLLAKYCVAVIIQMINVVL